MMKSPKVGWGKFASSHGSIEFQDKDGNPIETLLMRIFIKLLGTAFC